MNLTTSMQFLVSSVRPRFKATLLKITKPEVAFLEVETNYIEVLVSHII